jgi:hypothetical protein
MPHDQQTIEQTERDCRHDEQIDRGDTVGMIAEERLPPLGRRTSPLGHIFSHARLSDRDVELENARKRQGTSQNKRSWWAVRNREDW